MKIEMKFPLWKQAVTAKQGEIAQAIAAAMQTNRAMLFDTEGAYNGHPPWAPLKFRNGQILSDTGTLRKSIGPFARSGKPVSNPNGIVRYAGSAVDPMVTIGTTLIYAALMNNGGVVRPVGAKALAIPLPMGRSATPYAKKASKKASTVAKSRALLEEMRKIHARTGSRILEAKIARVSKFIEHRKDSQRVLFLQKVTIPARPFDQWNTADQKELEIVLMNKLAKVLNGARNGR